MATLPNLHTAVVDVSNVSNLTFLMKSDLNISNHINYKMLDDYDSQAWKEIFFKVNFNVDQCLSTYTQKSDLHSLKKELKQYGSELHTAMSEILKTETEAIVFLAENLTNLSTKIEDLSVPVSQLAEEIRSLHEAIKVIQDAFETHLNAMKLNRTELDNLKLQLEMISSVLYTNNVLKMEVSENEGLLYLERAVNKFAFQKIYLSEMGNEKKLFDVSNISDNLTKQIDYFFLQALKKSDPERVKQCLRLYVALDLQNKAESIYRKEIVKPVLESIFTERNLERHHQQLKGVYQDALTFVDSHMKLILDILKQNSDLKGFNFVLHSYWLEVDKQLRDGLPNITAPGNPDLFQQRFQESWDFFKAIATLCNNVDLLKQDKTFREHIKRFNLAVYFEIRFQQIVTKLEEELLVNTFTFVEDEFNLKVTVEMWKSFLTCFDEKVFMEQISDQFVKLSMLIVSRYLTCLDKLLPALKEREDKGESFLFNAIVDLETLKNYIGDQSCTVESTVYAKLPKFLHNHATQIIKINAGILDINNQKLRQVLVEMKVQECTEQLGKVDSIPRLYRRTNKSFPKEPSGYVTTAIGIISKFENQFSKFKNRQCFMVVLDEIISKISVQYLNHVREVLNNVCKTEESLRRLKSRNQPTVEESAQSGDEKKIREQIKIDVTYFKSSLAPLSRRASKPDLEKLMSECNL